MSLILDALKQADRERKITHAPDVRSALNAKIQAPPHRRIRLWLCAAVLAVGALCAFIFWPERPEPMSGKTSEQPRGMVSRDSDRAVGDPGGALSRRTVEKGKAPFRGINKPASNKKPPRLERKTPLNPAGPSRSAQPPARGAVRENAPAAVPKNSAPARMKALPERTTDDQPQDKAEVEDKIPEPVAGDAERDLPLVSELPPDIRGSLRELEISAHVFDVDPSRRFVFINQRSYRTGDRIGEDGPLLKEITPDGIVIDYGDGQARLQVKRPAIWSE